MKKRIVIIGATSAIATHCARLWAEEAAVDLVLAGRNTEKLSQMTTDLQIRSPQSTIQIQQANFVDPILIQKQVDDIVAQGAVDIVLIAHGSLPDQQICQKDLQTCQDALAVNAISPVLFAEAFAGHMEKANKGTLAIISSVAGERGRKSNYVYGAAKGLVSKYAQGLQHRLARTNVKVVLIKPGPTDTPMTAHLKVQSNKMANVSDVADLIVQKIKQAKAEVYAPAKWAVIMMVIRNMPRMIFNKMNI